MPNPPRRVALLIGNAAYTSGMPALTYPLQDIRVLEQSLKKLNFEVQVIRNADQKAMGRAIRDFGTSAREAQVALVYYSGHGMQARDENYLIPVGATIETEGDLDIEAIQLKALMRQIEDARPKTTVVVLDACRDNPVASRTKSGSKGLSRVQNPPNNTLVVFAALPGTTATDNGVFAKELANRLVEPNVGIRTVFDKVGQAVRQATGQKQSIQRDDQLSEDVVLLANARVEPVPVPVPAPVPAPIQDGPTAAQIEQQAWETASRGNAEAGFRAYLSEYPQGRFAGAARVAIATLGSASRNVQQQPDRPAVTAIDRPIPRGLVRPSPSGFQKWAFFCGDDNPGWPKDGSKNTWTACSNEDWSYDIPWTGPNLDGSKERSMSGSDKFNDLIFSGGYKKKAAAFCQANGYGSANGWPLAAWTADWKRNCAAVK
jgi:hypothetical protein